MSANQRARGVKSLAGLNRSIAATAPLEKFSARPVFGEGPLRPDIALVGEQPGDQEDIAGKPFVGPAGQLLDSALEEAGIDRAKIYVTNAVKHFKFEQRGKRRIHARPNAGDVKHYRWWLEKELELVRPRLVVALGATALLALSGKALPVGKNRGPMTFGKWPGYVTVHPSSILRMKGGDRAKAFRAFVSDFRRARAMTPGRTLVQHRG